jgi:uncharacterized protein (TIGR04255 family)
MSSHSPDFLNPPVVETVLSLQFSPIKNFTSAHTGLFWKNYLSKRWTSLKAAPPLDDHFERFTGEKHWTPVGSFQIVKGFRPERLQIIRDDSERMIQIQDSRFIYNWRKQKDHYPRYEKILPKFKKQYRLFENFIRDEELGTLQPNQWEVTYVNHLIRGELWSETKDWQRIFPWFSFPAVGINGQIEDGFSGEWSLSLVGNLGRLHVQLQHVRIGDKVGDEALALQFTARGPINPEKELDIESVFELGHSSIVWSFADMTSKEVHEKWNEDK